MCTADIAFYDELELCNPLGTHVKKHKLGIVLFTLSNIHPRHRSSLKATHLVIAATMPVIEKHAIDKILEPFIADLNVLASDGVKVTLNDAERTFQGGLLLWLVHNFATNTVLGFKESFIFRFCRTCYVTNNRYKMLSTVSELELSNKRKHCSECDLLEGTLFDHYSKT